MLRTVSTMAALAGFAAAALMALPAFVQASAPGAKSDLDISVSCELRSWPYYDSQCLRDGSRNAGRAAAVRIVTTDRIGEDQDADEAAAR